MAEIDTSVEFLGRRLAAPAAHLLHDRRHRDRPAGSTATWPRPPSARASRWASDRSAKRWKIRGKLIPSASARSLPRCPCSPTSAPCSSTTAWASRECRQAVEMIGADALVLHLNPLQEALQPEGQCNFSGLLPKIGEVVRELGVPVVAKEVGCGLSEARGPRAGRAGSPHPGHRGRRAARAGRASRPPRSGDLDLGEIFAGWGIPTPLSIQQVRRGSDGRDGDRQRRPAQRPRRSPRPRPGRRPGRHGVPVPRRGHRVGRDGSPTRCGASSASSRSACSASGVKTIAELRTSRGSEKGPDDEQPDDPTAARLATRRAGPLPGPPARCASTSSPRTCPPRRRRRSGGRALERMTEHAARQHRAPLAGRPARLARATARTSSAWPRSRWASSARCGCAARAPTATSGCRSPPPRRRWWRAPTAAARPSARPAARWSASRTWA